MREQPIYFGPNNALLGILTTPTTPRSDSPTVILLNAGLLTRVGPNRLYVELARSLAASGYRCFRFDMSGVGDSELQGGGLLYIERSTRDVVEAMDSLAAPGNGDRFVLMGLCTGAFSAFRAALIDERVDGCVLLDGYSYPTPRSRWRHYRNRILEPDRWARYAARRLRRAETAGDHSDDLIIFENETVPRERFARELTALLNRGTSLLMVYTGLGPLAFNYRRQLHDALPEVDLDPQVCVQYYPDADHTFTLPANRRRVLTDILAWMNAREAR